MRKMKDSGIEWIGEIPEDWEVLPFRHVLQERNERNNPVVSEERLSLSIERGVTLYADKTTNLDRFKDDFAQYKLAYIGDLVMNSMNMIVGATGVSKWFGCVSPVYYTFYDNDIEHTTAKFCEYIFRSKTMLRVLHSFGKGIYSIDRGDDKINTCRLKVAKSDLKNIKIPIPQISEQKLIIQFLDKKCSEIDSVILKTRETIEEYKKLKQAIITEAVTKGLNPNAKMKNSGIEWIGEIPEEWKKIKFKYLHYSMNTGEAIDKEYWSSNEYDRVFYTAGLLPIRTTYLEFPEWKLTRDNDLLLSRNGTPYVYLPSEYACYTDHIIRAKIKKDVCKKFLQYALQRSISTIVVNQVSIATWSASLWNEQILPFPPLSEQQQIADYLDQKCSEIDNLITKKEQLVVELESYKKSLIYEVVTGKRGV